jgi:DnaD/phage-associated family protein
MDVDIDEEVLELEQEIEEEPEEFEELEELEELEMEEPYVVPVVEEKEVALEEYDEAEEAFGSTKTNKEDDDDKDKSWQEVLKAYQNNINPVMGAWELEKLQDLFDDFKETWVTEAIKEAVEHNARSLRYITVTLEQWQRDGFKVDKRKKPQSSKRKANSYSQDDYEKVLAELERKDSNAREG